MLLSMYQSVYRVAPVLVKVVKVEVLVWVWSGGRGSGCTYCRLVAIVVPESAFELTAWPVELILVFKAW